MTNLEAIKILSAMNCDATPEVKEAVQIAVDALQKVGDWLSINELYDLCHAIKDYVGDHVWVKDLVVGTTLACVIDSHYDYGIVALYGAVEEEEWFMEKDYGKTWVAYLEKPVCAD